MDIRNSRDYTKYLEPLLDLLLTRIEKLHVDARSALGAAERDRFGLLLLEKAKMVAGLPFFLPVALDGVDEIRWASFCATIDTLAKQANTALRIGETPLMAKLLLLPESTDICENNLLRAAVEELESN